VAFKKKIIPLYFDQKEEKKARNNMDIIHFSD
jgi:hypothetical protein